MHVFVFVFQSALQSSPWGLMQLLEQQFGELRIDTDDGCYEGAQGDTGDSRPSSGTSTILNLYFPHTFLNAHIVMKASESIFYAKLLLSATKLFSLCIVKYAFVRL